MYSSLTSGIREECYRIIKALANHNETARQVWEDWRNTDFNPANLSPPQYTPSIFTPPKPERFSRPEKSPAKSTPPQPLSTDAPSIFALPKPGLPLAEISPAKPIMVNQSTQTVDDSPVVKDQNGDDGDEFWLDWLPVFLFNFL
jgi:hypothetical protein